MKLRTYLVKRTIHMIITVLIVLVLLFVLFRMMPGSAAAGMMMNPRMTQNEIDLVLVRYGFGRWSDYPGEYTMVNYNPQMIGRYSVTVQAVDDAGQADSFSTYFDVNAPEDVDYVAPTVTDVGLTSAAIGAKADFYLIAHDEGAIRSVEATILCPNLVLDGGVPVLFTETFPLVPVSNMSDEANRTFYYSGSTPTVLSMGAGGSSDFQISFNVLDRSRNVATAAVEFDGVTGTETAKLWGLSADIPSSNYIYSYPLVNQAVSLSANVNGGTPSFSMVMSDQTTTQAITAMTGTVNYTGAYTATENGILSFIVEIGNLSASLPVVVNSVSVMPAPIEDDDSTSPVLSNLIVMSLNADGVEVVSPEYPFPLSNLRLRINATALNSKGVRCDDITVTIVSPNGAVITSRLTHPTYVEMRTMAEQFVIYMKTMLVFDFGTSYMYQRSTWEVIIERIPSTMLLFGSAMIVSYILGILIGVVVAWRRGTVMEMGTIVVTLFFYSMPIFWFALIMQWVFYAQLGWFPLGGMGGNDPVTGAPLQGLDWYLNVLHHLVMPLITLVVLGLAGTILLMRAAMLEVMGEDFTITAKAKGLKERTVVYKHVARNAMLPVVTSMAMSIGGIISGGVLTETIFSWYGMGTLLIEGTLSKDFPVVQGAFYIMALLTIIGNMGADILYAWLDPRVQL
ncbi:MAG: ABC transporter permease [Candidatus Thermoplasmatota archaeon]|nr:ABC transporter permease subunit [Euryarchaeota archaeon]MBU4032523.1 ABC transporter permease [Candidatus Thermoplasmatota archaeon]MBU4072059.1 ABC transporter permease [Candidatus Thermoplasmatota archaeon]MBU4144611.1 ABC transporter permease [Candidatus Thermoplasmatota archaeon]MBU4592371.1 ABC transporter permease [Candidatus Thermoplasmatota archaeon]